ncbi:unnamed protein product [Clavelina lepadiformis]|uniref:BRCA1-associated protein n=1 Tax=Clavelina lepadiformis TaxID=159417 RepID=A0ABP0GY10_CLALP
MKICFVHVKISIAYGHALPQINFRAPFISDDLTPRHNQDISAHQFSFSYNPKKFNRTISCEKKESKLRVTWSSSKGLRLERELIIETFENPEYVLHQDDDLDQNDCNVSGEVVNFVGSKANLLPETNMSHSSALCDVKETKTKELCDLADGIVPSEESSPSMKFSLSDTPTSSAASNKGNGPAHSTTKQLRSISFFSGNPTVDITNGIIHLYKMNSKISIGADFPSPETDTLCMLSVPASIDAHGIMEFVAPYRDVISRMRIIRDRTPNQYMVLITFVTHHNACEFFLNMNNQNFSSLMPEEICHLAFVASVEAVPTYEIERKSEMGFLPPPNSTELPDCMVCLERMDESVQGLLTILCNHSFHAACLQQWEDLCCPVCRYVQTPEPQSDNKCMTCNAKEDLWICLICGNVGCGRYTSEHAQQHFMETQHNYAMALNDNRVWDYAGDYFVHRLFQTKEEGKLVEKQLEGGADHDVKLQTIEHECMRLLTSQLECQRKYWEEQVILATKKATSNPNEAELAMENTIKRCKDLELHTLELKKEKDSLSQRNKHLSTKMGGVLRELQSEQELNKALTRNQEDWKAKVVEMENCCKKQEDEIKDLKDQLRDVMFYIEARQKIQSETDQVQSEIKDGQVVLGPSRNSNQKERKTKKK